MGYNGLSRLSKIRQTIPLPLKQTQALEKACFLVNYSPKQEPNKSSSLRTRCHEVLRATMCPQVPQADRCTHFYMECDITLAIYVKCSGLNGGKASDWLRLYVPNWAVSYFEGGV